MPDVATVWTVRLWGLTSPRADVLATLVTVAALAASRFALLPSGPWDWDETLFARGILKFDLPGHYPHPPGFPLWMLLGWLVHFFVSEPLVGLQLLSAAASCLTLWPLAALGRKVAPPAVAVGATLLVLFLPGVWLHAGRGFSSTPAAFIALWAAALAWRPADRRQVTAFTCLVTAAFLIRPILLPSLALLWLAGVWQVTPRRRLLPGVAAASAAVLLAVVGMVIAQGSWSEFARPFAVHGRTHARNLLGNTGGFAELGIVKGAGGATLACLLLVLAAIGVARWMRRGGRNAAITWIAVVGIGVGELIWLQNRTFSRYAVPFQLAAAPPVAAAAALAPPALGASVLLAAAAATAMRGWPTVVEQHARLLPGWESLLFAARAAARSDCDLVVDGGLYPFVSYLSHRERAAGRGWSFKVFLPPANPEATGAPQRCYLLVTDVPENYLPAPWGRRWRWGEVSRELHPLTSGRFLNSTVVEGAILPVRAWWLPEKSGGNRFMWGGANAELLLPPLAPTGSLALELLPTRGAAPLAVLLNGADVAFVPGDARRLTLPLAASVFSPTKVNRLTFRREHGYPPQRGDSRPLAVCLYGLTSPSGDPAWAARRRLTSLLASAEVKHRFRFPAEGFYRPEHFAFGRAAWTRPRASMNVPLAPGVLTFTLWAPRPDPVDLKISIDGQPVAGPLSIGRNPQTFSIALTNRQTPTAPARLELGSRPYTPATAGSTDSRELGVVLAAVELVPTAAQAAQGWLAVPDSNGSSLLWAPARGAALESGVGWTASGRGDQKYLLGGEGSLLALPEAASGDRFLLEVSAPSHSAAVQLLVDAQPIAVLLPGSPRAVLEVPARAGTAAEPALLTVQRARRTAGDVKVYLHSVAVRTGNRPWAGAVAHPLDRARLGVRLEAPPGGARRLPASGLHQVELFPAGRGSWTFPEAELRLPAAAGVLRLTLAAPRPTPPELELLVEGHAVAGPLAVGREPQEFFLTIPPQPASATAVRVGLRATAYSPGGSDPRQLGVVVLGGELAAAAAHATARWLLDPPATDSTWTLTEVPHGAYTAERFAEGEGCWLLPRAWLSVPAGNGVLTLTAWAPRPVPARLEIWRNGALLAGPVDLPNHPTQLDIPLQASSTAATEAVLELKSEPYSPHRHSHGSDRRELGIVLSHLAFRPSGERSSDRPEQVSHGGGSAPAGPRRAEE